MPMARDLFVNKLLKKSFGQNLSPPELADRLLSPNRSEEERFKDLGNALGWIAKELKSFKAQDQQLMRQFVILRAEINKLKDNQFEKRRGSLLDIPRTVEEREFEGVKDCKLDPFDADDTIPLRRRAFSSHDVVITRNQLLADTGNYFVDRTSFRNVVMTNGRG